MAAASKDSFMFTVGKLDAGMAILLGERAHLIEFPSLLLPTGVTAGSIVNISVTQNISEEEKRDKEFWDLQEDIYKAFGQKTPEPPKLKLRNVTQTSVTLEWDSLELATAKLRSLDVYRNGQRLASIPSPLQNTSTKLSGLALSTEYALQLVLRTTAGTYPSNLLTVKTHSMTDTSGICVCFGTVQDPVMVENAKMALDEMGAKWSDKIQIDTTHFVCTTPAATPASGAPATAPGVEYQRALQLSIPIVQPQWILACHAEKRMVPIKDFYLGSTPASPAHNFSRPQSMSQASLPSAGTPSRVQHANHQSLPAQSASQNKPTFGKQPATNGSVPHLETMQEEDADGNEVESSSTKTDAMIKQARQRREGTMDKQFKFPPPADATNPPPLPTISKGTKSTSENSREDVQPNKEDVDPNDGAQGTEAQAIPSIVEVPPPPPVEKDSKIPSVTVNDEMDEVGETEEISLN